MPRRRNNRRNTTRQSRRKDSVGEKLLRRHVRGHAVGRRAYSVRCEEIEIDTSDVDLSYRDRYTPVEDSSGELRKCLDRLMFGDIGRNRRRFQKSIVDNCGTGPVVSARNTCATKSGYAGP